MKRTDWFALGLALLAVIAAYLVSNRVFENLAHVEDEQAFVWQAAVLARGHLTLPSPPQSHSFLWPFVIDYQGQQALTSQRFGKYPLGWPLVLSAGVILGIRDWVNPLLAGLGVWLTYLLGKRVFTPLIGLLAAGLTLTSPFFLIISGSLFSHPLGLVLSAGFVLAWLNAFFRPDQDNRRAWWSAILAGLALGFLFFTRPWTAVAVGLPFGVHGIILLVRGSRSEVPFRTVRLQVVALGVIAVLVGALQFGWQWLATGNPLTNLYTLWWPYDKVGFGPGYGVREEGHSLAKGLNHTRISLKKGLSDLFGWWKISWIFLPFGLWAAWKLPQRSDRRSRISAFLILSPFLSLVLFHLAYWVGSYLLGPRYYYEGLFGLTIFSAAGIAWLAGWPTTIQSQPGSDQVAPPSPRLRTPEVLEVLFHIFRRLRAILVPALVIGLVCYNLFFYLPGRLKPLYGLYGVSRSNLEPFLTEEAQALTPAIVIVHIRETWIEYGALLELQSPYLDSPFIFVISRGEEDDRKVVSHFPERRVIHYYPSDPENFYDTPQNGK